MFAPPAKAQPRASVGSHAPQLARTVTTTRSLPQEESLSSANALALQTVPSFAKGFYEPRPSRPGAIRHRLPLQRKLQVGAVDDPLEAQAEEMAQRVMRMPSPEVL